MLSIIFQATKVRISERKTKPTLYFLGKRESQTNCRTNTNGKMENHYQRVAINNENLIRMDICTHLHITKLDSVQFYTDNTHKNQTTKPVNNRYLSSYPYNFTD